MNKQSIIDIAVLKEKLQEYATKVGRISARPLLLLYLSTIVFTNYDILRYIN